MKRVTLFILSTLLLLSIFTACIEHKKNPDEFNHAIENMAAKTISHTYEEFVMIYPDVEVTQHIDRKYANGNCLYTWAQDELPPSTIVEYQETRFELYYTSDTWVPSEFETTLTPYHLNCNPSNYSVESIEQTADGYSVSCQIITKGTDFLEAYAEFVFDHNWNVLSYTTFTTYMTENYEGIEFQQSISNTVNFLLTSDEEIQQAIVDAFTEAQADCG